VHSNTKIINLKAFTTSPVLLWCPLWCHLLNSKEGAYGSQKYSDHLRMKSNALNYILGHYFKFYVVHNFLECYNCPSFFVYSLEVIVEEFYYKQSQNFVATIICRSLIQYVCDIRMGLSNEINVLCDVP